MLALLFADLTTWALGTRQVQCQGWNSINSRTDGNNRRIGVLERFEDHILQLGTQLFAQLVPRDSLNDGIQYSAKDMYQGELRALARFRGDARQRRSERDY
jgi:hypothetical protein